MQTVFEIFDPVTGRTEGYKTREATDQFLARMDRAGYVRDFLPVGTEGFFVVDMRGKVDFGSARTTREAAQRIADFSNQGSDTNSFSVIEHRL